MAEAKTKPTDQSVASFIKKIPDLYIMSGTGIHTELLKKLGKHSVGGGCLYIKRLSDIDLPTLKKLIRESVKQKKRGPQKS